MAWRLRSAIATISSVAAWVARSTTRGAAPAFEGFLPAGRAQTPLIARTQPREAELMARRRQVVAAGAGELEELRRHAGAYGVAAHVFIRGVAAAVAEEARHRIFRARLDRLAEHVRCRIHTHLPFPFPPPEPRRAAYQIRHWSSAGIRSGAEDHFPLRFQVDLGRAGRVGRISRRRNPTSSAPNPCFMSDYAALIRPTVHRPVRVKSLWIRHPCPACEARARPRGT